MKAIFNFKLVISDDEVKTTFDTGTVENMGIAQQQALLKVFSDVERKTMRIMGLENKEKERPSKEEQNEKEGVLSEKGDEMI